MALFNKSSPGPAGQEDAVPFVEQQAPSDVQDDYLGQFEGEGLDKFGAETVATPWISVMQDRTKHVLDGVCPPGVWRNSATGDVYGKTLRIIPIDFKVIWNERDPETGTTIQNHEPGTFQPRLVPVKGGRGYPRMLNPETNNRIDETFLYAVVLADDPNAGYALVQAGMGSIGAFKRWNAQLRAQILPNSKRAPLFAYVWELTIGDDQVQNKNGQLYFRVQNVKRAELVSKDLFVTAINPNRQLALTASLALTAPEEEKVEQVEE